MSVPDAIQVEALPSAKGASESSVLVVRSAYSLMLNTVLTSVLGVGYWVAAARLFKTAAVGRDSAMIFALTALSAVGGLNLHNTVLRFLPARRDRPARALLVAYGLACAATGVLALAFVLVIPRVSHAFDVLSKEPALAVIYVVGAMAGTVFLMEDAALTALRRAAWVPIENSAYGVLKLAALPLLAAAAAHDGVLIAWVVPILIIVVPVNWLVFGRLLPAHARQPAVEAADVPTRLTLRFALQDAIGFTLNIFALTALPLLVVALVGARENAHFFMPFTIIVTFDLLFLNVANSLVAEGARGEMAVHELARTVIRRFLPLLALGIAVLVVAAPLVLLLFGPSYASHGSAILRLMALAGIFRAAIALFVALSRLRRAGFGIVVVEGAFAVIVVALAAVLANSHGARGVAVAWLIASAVVGVAVLPALRRMLRGVPEP
jgi:O-antigen/teichoic acid export membrane protein